MPGKESKAAATMPPRRGNKKSGRTNTKTPSHCSNTKDTSAKVTTKNTRTETCCGTCGSATDKNSLGCDSCPLRFHDTPSCAGLPQSAIQGLKDAAGAGLRYVCTSCRGGSGTQPRGKASGGGESVEDDDTVIELDAPDTPEASGDNTAFSQLSVTIKALCTTIADLEKNVSALTVSQASKTPVNKPSSLRESPEIEIIKIVEPRKRQRVTGFARSNQ